MSDCHVCAWNATGCHPVRSALCPLSGTWKENPSHKSPTRPIVFFPGILTVIASPLCSVMWDPARVDVGTELCSIRTVEVPEFWARLRAEVII